MTDSPEIVRAAIATALSGFDDLYSYTIPDTLAGKIKPGARILVPFGRNNRPTIALAMEITERCGDMKLKSVSSVIDSEPLVTKEMIGMIRWLKEHTFCTYFDAFRTVVPGGFSVKRVTRYELSNTEHDLEDLTPEESEMYSALTNAADRKAFDKALGISEKCDPAEKARRKKVLDSLIDKGIVEEVDHFLRSVGDKSSVNAVLTEKYVNGELDLPRLTAKQQAVVDQLMELSSAAVDELCYMTGCTKAVIKRLEDKGVIRLYKEQMFRNATEDAEERRDINELVLNSEQQAAFEGIAELIKAGKPAGALLYGVTGSGKTAVFFKLIRFVLDLGRSVIMLVPEISLTPQMVQKFKMYFGNDIALMHSSLSLGQRMDEYKRVQAGKARIVIGTRSAVFAPFDDPGLIIMDEEGERTYKSDRSPRYHARDVAIQRCGYHSCVLLMASATPSIESFYYAKNGRFSLFEMKKRYAEAKLPEVEIVDMQTEELAANDSVFSRRLADSIEETLQRNEQAILLLNRRGYTTYLSCRNCRQPISCPNCDLPLTYHKKNSRLMCHYCGYSMNKPQSCPLCGCTDIKQSGVGTQKIEDELHTLYPKARLLRMDADTTFTRGAYEESFAAFANHEYDIMLGTQMIAKGLNFPDVTLVGVISVDKALFTGDFRSYERTFSLITQVAGRSGRGDKPGRAFIQTFVPDHYVLNLAAAQDYDEFYAQESELRKALLFPPYCDICSVVCSGVRESAASEAAMEFLKILRGYIKDNALKIPLRVLGPSPCALERINNRYRYRIIIKCRLSPELRKMIFECMEKLRSANHDKYVRVTADFNGDIGL